MMCFKLTKAGQVKLSNGGQVMSEKEKSSQGKKKVSPYMKVMNALQEHYNQKHKQLLGELLTTLEATVDDERKLEALRSRVRNIQSLAWEEMNQEFWGSLDAFEQTDTCGEFEVYMGRCVQHFLTKYGGVIQTLVSAVFDDRRRADALNREVIRLVYVTRDSIRRALTQIIASNFPVPKSPGEKVEK